MHTHRMLKNHPFVTASVHTHIASARRNLLGAVILVVGSLPLDIKIITWKYFTTSQRWELIVGSVPCDSNCKALYLEIIRCSVQRKCHAWLLQKKRSGDSAKNGRGYGCKWCDVTVQKVWIVFCILKYLDGGVLPRGVYLVAKVLKQNTIMFANERYLHIVYSIINFKF